MGICMVVHTENTVTHHDNNCHDSMTLPCTVNTKSNHLSFTSSIAKASK